MTGPSRSTATAVGAVGQDRTDRDVAAWAASGVAALSGPPPGGTSGPPAGLVGGVEELGRRITSASGALGAPVALDWLALLGERAALDGLRACGRTSCGGATRLLACADGWIAVGLARPDDVAALPAWLALAGADEADAHRLLAEGLGDTDPPAAAHRAGAMAEELGITAPAGGRVRWDDSADGRGDADVATAVEGRRWDALAAAIAHRPGAALVDAAAVLGLPVGLLGERAQDATDGVAVHRLARVRASTHRDDRAGERSGRPLVVDLSALWAGPLCASVLALAGLDVVKVESEQRPDAARRGSPGLHALLNGPKASHRVDLSTAAGRSELAAIIHTADVVVESSRPRALEQLGVVADEQLASPDGPSVWVSITGHGRRSPRVAFGDDAAVAGGLVVRTDDGPWFCGDAIADPLSGLAAAASTLEVLAEGGSALVEVAMAAVAAAHAGPTLPAGAHVVAPPRARSHP